MKYKIKNTALFHKGKLVPENSITEMTEKEAEEFSGFLEPITEKSEMPSSSTAAKTKPKKTRKKRTKKNI
jgi:hypothetical protein